MLVGTLQKGTCYCGPRCPWGHYAGKPVAIEETCGTGDQTKFFIRPLAGRDVLDKLPETLSEHRWVSKDMVSAIVQVSQHGYAKSNQERQKKESK